MGKRGAGSVSASPACATAESPGAMKKRMRAKAVSFTEYIEIHAAPSAPTMSLNAELLTTLQACDETILGNSHFQGLPHQLPFGSADGQGLPAYDIQMAKSALAQPQGEYVCSGNIYWLLLSYEVQPMVPRQLSKLIALQKHFFANPTRMPDEIVIALEGETSPDQHFGSLKAVSAPDMRDARRMAVADAVRDGSFGAVEPPPALGHASLQARRRQPKHPQAPGARVRRHWGPQ